MPNKPAPSLFTYASLACAGLMWVLPFLYYHHAYPLTTFYQEWSAVILGLCAMPLLVTQRFWQLPEIPRATLLPVGLILVVLVQWGLGKIAYSDQALLFILYLLWVALLAMLGYRLREEAGLPLLATTLAVCLVLGAELSALAGVLQHFRWHTPLDAVITAKISAAVYGNLAQPNHFANYVALGLISIGLLLAARHLPAWLAALLAAPLLFVMALSGSRSAWLYLSFMAVLAFLWQRHDRQHRPLLYYSLLLLPGFALMNALLQLPLFAAGTSTVQRLIEGGTGNSIRLYLWQEAWLIFTQHPLLGAGFGQFAWQHFLLGPELRATYITGLYNNAHNLVMQLAAETGLAGLATLFATLALWLKQAYISPRSLYHWWGYALLGVLAIHSLLEYPLWYAYFLGVAAFALGAMDHSTYRLELRSSIGRWSLMAILLLGTANLYQMQASYRNLEALMVMRPGPAAGAEFNQRLREILVDIQGRPLLRPYAEMMMSNLIETSANHLTEKRMLNGNVMHFVPIGTVVYRETYLLALSGKLQAAKQQMERAIWSYPGDFPSELEKLRELALNDPAHFAALLEFALQKYEDRQRAILSG